MYSHKLKLEINNYSISYDLLNIKSNTQPCSQATTSCGIFDTCGSEKSPFERIGGKFRQVQECKYSHT